MLNHIVLVGRIANKPEVVTTESGKKVSMVTLAVSRSYKNQNGEYDADFIDCTLWTGIAENTAEYCSTGDLIGVRGRLQSRLIEKDDGTKYKKVDVVAERVTFLSSSKNGKDSEIVIDDDALKNDEESLNDGKKCDKKDKKKK